MSDLILYSALIIVFQHILSTQKMQLIQIWTFQEVSRNRKLAADFWRLNAVNSEKYSF